MEIVGLEDSVALDYRMLGPLELRTAGGVLPVGGRRQQTLLAVLLLGAGRTVSFDRLVTDLWERPPATARRQVVNAAVAVRRTVEHAGGGPLVTTNHGYQLETAGDRLDIAAFTALRHQADSAAAAGRLAEAVRLLHDALDTWRGPVLAGLGGETIELARRGLTEQRLDAVERLAALRLQLGEVSPMVGLLARLVAEHPARESLRAALMRTLEAAGRTADALAVFAEGRRVLAEEFGADPGPQLRDLHERLLRQDGAPTGHSHRPVVSAAPAGGPCFLPNSIPDFTGRQADIDRLTALSAPGPTGATAVVTVEGMGGVGKTALAVHVAHRLAGEYPDGQHFVDLRGFTEDERPMPPEAALEVLLRQAGVPAAEIPAGTMARQDLWRAAMAGRRALVLLDNAAEAAQLRPLLPASPSSLVLVTSRRQLLALDGAAPLPLGVLDATEAVALFGRIAGPRDPGAGPDGRREPDGPPRPSRANADLAAVREVVELCGGLPLAIRIAAARFRRRPTWTLADLASQLRGQHGLTAGDRSVAGIIELSQRDLSPGSRRLFHLLALVPGPDFDGPAAAALAGLPVAAAQAGLEELLECNLLVQDTRGRLRLHGLVRECARTSATRERPEPELREARHRLFDYYLHFLDVHGGQLGLCAPPLRPDLRYPPPPLPAAQAQQDTVRLLEAEYDNVVAAAGYAIGHGWLQHAWQLPCLLLPFLLRVGMRAGMLDLASNAVAATRELGDPRAESLALANLAVALRGQGRQAQAQAALEHSVRISRDLGDQAALAARLHDLGSFLFQAGHLAEAAVSFAEARDLAHGLGDTVAEASHAFNLAVVDSNLGRYESALAHFNHALDHHRHHHDAVGECAALINIGWLGQLLDRDGDAVAALDRAARLSATIGAVRTEARALAWLCVSHRRRGQLAQAVEVGRAAVDRARRGELPEEECDALNGLAEAYLAAGRLAAAETQFRAAQRLAGLGAMPLAAGRAVEGLAHLAASRGAHEQARELWEGALAGYPPGAVGAEHPRAHLAAPKGATVRCLRCLAGPAPG